MCDGTVRKICGGPVLRLTLFFYSIHFHLSLFRSYIAKNALSLLERFDVGGDQISGVFMNFYGRIAWHYEPFQVCGDNLRRGFESGLSSGSNLGFHCAFHVIKTAIISGEKLDSLLKEIDYYLHLLKTYKSELMKNALLISRETVSALIDKGEATSIEAKVFNNSSQEPVFFHQAYRAFWSGYTVRCHHYFENAHNYQDSMFNLIR